MTQKARLLAYLETAEPSSLEITLALNLINVTGRISDLRADGHRIDCYRDERGVARYRLVRALTLWERAS